MRDIINKNKRLHYIYKKNTKWMTNFLNSVNLSWKRRQRQTGLFYLYVIFCYVLLVICYSWFDPLCATCDVLCVCGPSVYCFKKPRSVKNATVCPTIFFLIIQQCVPQILVNNPTVCPTNSAVRCYQDMIVKATIWFLISTQLVPDTTLSTQWTHILLQSLSISTVHTLHSENCYICP